jgi:hypothetical protein
MAVKICTKCKAEKSETDFYKRAAKLRADGTTDGSYKRTCKKCENTRRCEYEEYNCIVCDIIINKRCKIKHEKSHKHLMKYMWNE